MPGVLRRTDVCTQACTGRRACDDADGAGTGWCCHTPTCVACAPGCPGSWKLSPACAHTQTVTMEGPGSQREGCQRAATLDSEGSQRADSGREDSRTYSSHLPGDGDRRTHFSWVPPSKGSSATGNSSGWRTPQIAPLAPSAQQQGCRLWTSSACGPARGTTETQQWHAPKGHPNTEFPP